MRSNVKAIAVVSCFALALKVTSLGQSIVPTSAASNNLAIPSPKAAASAGKQDDSALAELRTHRDAAGAKEWTSMQGIGKITYGPLDSATYEATITNLGPTMFRLDSQDSKGGTSLRIVGGAVRLRDAKGTIFPLSSDTAAFGVFPFQILRSRTLLSAKNSLVDKGVVAVDGRDLRRLTLDKPGLGIDSDTHAAARDAIDLYLDPKTHLLAQTVSMISVGRGAKLMCVTTYSDYRLVETVMVPFRFDETIAGEHSRTLQLTSVKLNPAITSTYFEF